jgi:hypothetical protein
MLYIYLHTMFYWVFHFYLYYLFTHSHIYVQIYFIYIFSPFYSWLPRSWEMHIKVASTYWEYKYKYIFVGIWKKIVMCYGFIGYPTDVYLQLTYNSFRIIQMGSKFNNMPVNIQRQSGGERKCVKAVHLCTLQRDSANFFEEFPT